jgi:hypothetical protein
MEVAGDTELDGEPVKILGNAWLEPVDGRGFPAGASFKDGAFRFGAVYPGRYHVAVRPVTGMFAQEFYFDSVRLGERDVSMDEIEVASGLLTLRVVLKTGGGHVRGTVENGSGGILVLVPCDERMRAQQFIRVSFFKGGSFTLDNVRPGNYYAFAIREGSFNESDMQDAREAAPYLDGAPAFRVDPDGTATLTLLYVKVPSSQ